jgi:acyl-[acyl carrier protein]--UDP-N-acetylglucosamine O-acyltransferase
MMTRSIPVRITRVYTKRVMRKAPAQHFAAGVAKTTVGSSFVELACHHHVPDIAIIVSDASVLQFISTVAWLLKELS